jgi:ClpP class serine protease
MKSPQMEQMIHGQPWLITREGLEAVQASMTRLGTEALQKEQGQRPSGTTLTTVRDGVAVIEVLGPLFAYSSLLSELLGWPSTEGLMQEIATALDNPSVSSVLLQIDSPGGQVTGVNELAGFLQGQNQKPVRAYVGGLAASAAYWIASATDEIIMEETAQAGGIGVVLNARRKSDDSTEIVSSVSPRKRPDPASDEGKKQLLQRVNDIAEVFVRSVASNRGLSREQVTSLEGDVTIASKVIQAGLADRIGTLEGVIEELQGKKMERDSVTRHGNAAASASSGGGQEFTQPPQGFEQAVQEYQNKNGCSRGEAMKAVAEENPKLYEEWLEAWQNHSPPRAQRKAEIENHDFWKAGQEYSNKHGVSLAEGLKAVAKQNPQAHRKFVEDMQHG